MIQVDDIADLGALTESIHLAMGVFDGVHIGHQAVIRRVLDGAKASGGLPGVLTFDPHPVSVVAPQHTPRRLLASIEHKSRVLSALGVKLLVVVRFDESFARREAEDFIRGLNDSSRDLRQLAVGEEWRFGRGRRGDIALLKRLGDELGLRIDGVPSLEWKGDRVSSTRIRSAIELGQLDSASAMLGRPYSVLGTVLPGRKIGRSIGFPTANLNLQNEQLPPSGVYAVKCALGSRQIFGVANLGYRPTVELESGRRLLEVHLFDFKEDIYNRELDVSFGEWLRPEKKFDDIDELKLQIARDCQRARDWMASFPS